jgi:hypothetical protein
MLATGKGPTRFLIDLDRDELTLLNNALNEILNGPQAIESSEFSTRVGSSRREAEALLAAIDSALGRATSHE